MEGGGVEHGPPLGLLVLDPLDVLGEHVVAEQRVGGVLAHQPVGPSVGRIAAAVDVLDVEVPAAGVEVLDHPGQQGLVLLGVELLVVGLPPDGFLEFGPGHTEGVLDGAAGAGGVGVEDQRAVGSQRGGESLLGVVRTLIAHPAAVVRDGLVEKLILAQVDAELHSLEPEESFEGIRVVVGGGGVGHSGVRSRLAKRDILSPTHAGTPP